MPAIQVFYRVASLSMRYFSSSVTGRGTRSKAREAFRRRSDQDHDGGWAGTFHM
jgi:hypothetical protein